MRMKLSKKTLLILGVAIVLIVFFALRAGSKNGTYEAVPVVQRDLKEEVLLAGTVEARSVADLGFEVSGTLTSLPIAENAVVPRGATLATLGFGTLSADLRSAQADVAIKRAETANTEIEVQNAYSELLSTNLVAKPQSADYTQTPPVISGRYNDTEEGTYKIRIKPKSQPGKFELAVFDLENPETVTIAETGPTALGARGLFISFPDGPATYRDTTWYVSLPNKEGTTYATLYSAYERAAAQLRAEQSGTSIAHAELLKAQAQVDRIQAEIAQRIIRAPFAGTVSAVHADVGEAVSPNNPVVSLISNDGFGVAIDVPEIDSIKVNVGDPVDITLDAFAGYTFAGTVTSMNRAETIVDNVSVYEGRIAFTEPDVRIASGMTAQVAIQTDAREGVLAVPVRAVKYREDGTTFVTVQDASGEPEERTVVVGMRSSDSFFEVLTGLAEGDVVRIAQ